MPLVQNIIRLKTIALIIFTILFSGVAISFLQPMSLTNQYYNFVRYNYYDAGCNSRLERSQIGFAICDEYYVADHLIFVILSQGDPEHILNSGALTDYTGPFSSTIRSLSGCPAYSIEGVGRVWELQYAYNLC